MSHVTQVDPALLRRAVEVCGPRHVLTDPQIVASWSTDWTGRFRFDPAPVIRPRDTAELAAIVEEARGLGVPLTPQGGNTGLVGGAQAGPGGVIVDLRRMGQVDRVDRRAGQLTAGAGVAIERVQSEARALGWAYGVDWAARQTATVGGSVATDAGGLRFVRHGSTRRQLLGVEAVLGHGGVISHLPEVEKDNTGYDLAGLMCGSEGTLGFVTAARLRLVAPSGPPTTALVAFERLDDAVTAAGALRRHLAGLEAVELMTRPGMDLVCERLGLAQPFARSHPCTLLVEVASADAETELGEAVGNLAGVGDVAVAGAGPGRRALWRLREAHTDAIATLGPAHKLDVSLPADHLAEFIEEVPALVASVAPEASTWCFGHAADGNVHVNVTGASPHDDRVDEVVLTEVAARGGSISAEHGIGRAKRRWLHLAHDPTAISTMRAIKAALDPDGICNPGVLLPDGP